ncbi:hypothetical protein [Methylobacterium frigidaeris]|nr:hypothetical protein [Methylobacterium frigidaeris]
MGRDELLRSLATGDIRSAKFRPVGYTWRRKSCSRPCAPRRC